MRLNAFALTLLFSLAVVARAEDKPKYPPMGTIERKDPRFDKLIPKDAVIEKLADGFHWAEGPVWVPKDGGYLLFSDIPKNIIWKWTEKFPGAVPETPFFNHIRHNQYSSDYYYTATPGAACSDIKSALALSAKLREFADRCGNEPPQQFAKSYAAFLTTVQEQMGQTGLPEWLQRWPASGAPAKSPPSPAATEARDA